MRPMQIALAGLALLALAGCRTDPTVALLERELRLQEDEIYRLRASLDDFQSCDVPAPQRDAADDAKKTSGESGGSQSSPDRESQAPNGITPPVIELPSQPGTKVPDVLKGSAQASGDSRRVAAIVLDQSLTGGVSADDSSGDQGLLVVAELRDRAGRTVDAPAEMSVALLDPALKDRDGKAVRIARWDFTTAETANMFRRSGARRAVYLTAAWPGEPPAHGNLHLFVRYVTTDGRKLVADMPVTVALAGEPTGRAARVAQAANAAAPLRPEWSPNRP